VIFFFQVDKKNCHHILYNGILFFRVCKYYYHHILYIEIFLFHLDKKNYHGSGSFCPHGKRKDQCEDCASPAIV
jgi:hypothetical protein